MKFGFDRPSFFLEKKVFENVDRRRRTTDDDVGPLENYKLTNEPSAQVS